MRRIDYIVLHCTAGPQTQTVPAIQAYWRSKGWLRDGYHFIILPDGTVVALVPIERPSNGVQGFNANAINICYIGGVELIPTLQDGRPVNTIGKAIDNRTPAQKESMRNLVEKHSAMFPAAVIQGHRDFSPDKNRDGIITPNEWIKTCPSFSVKNWLSEIDFKSKLDVIKLKTTATVNIRSGAGTLFSPVRPALKSGTIVRLLGEANGWTYVILLDGSRVKGWVSSQYLTGI